MLKTYIAAVFAHERVIAEHVARKINGCYLPASDNTDLSFMVSALYAQQGIPELENEASIMILELDEFIQSENARGSFHEKADTRPVFAYFMQFDSFSSEGRLSDAVSDLHYLLQEEDLCLANYEQLLYSLRKTDALGHYHGHADLNIEWMDAKTSIFTLGYSAAEILVKAAKVCWALVNRWAAAVLRRYLCCSV